MQVKYSELKKKEVYDVKSGEGLGKITDLIIDESCGKISKIIVPGKKGLFNFCEVKEINYCCIEKIGTDAILVRTGENFTKEEQTIKTAIYEEDE